MRNFTVKDFEGSGQYLLRMSPREIYCRDNDIQFEGYKDAGYLSTITKKVGYIHGKGFINKPKVGKGHIVVLMDLSDGWSTTGYYDTRNDPNRNDVPRKRTFCNTDTWIWVQFDNKQVFCDYLNNPELCQQEKRFATKAEILMVINNQNWRFKE